MFLEGANAQTGDVSTIELRSGKTIVLVVADDHERERLRQPARIFADSCGCKVLVDTLADRAAADAGRRRNEEALRQRDNKTAKQAR